MKSHWGLLALALLLGWWYVTRKRVAAVPVVAAPIPDSLPVGGGDTYPLAPTLSPTSLVDDGSIPPPPFDHRAIGPVHDPSYDVPFGTTDLGDGSSLTIAGYQLGDFSDAALAVLSLQSQWFLARTQSVHAYNGHPISLWEEWRMNRGDGVNGPAVGSQAAYKEAVRASIKAAFAGYVGSVDSMEYPVPDWFKSW